MLRLRPSVHQDGYGLPVVLILGFILLVLTSTAFLAARNTQLQTREQRNVTTARGVADGGAEQIIYELGLTGTQWTDYVGKTFTAPLGDGEYTVTVTQDGDKRIVNSVGEFPAGSGDKVEVEVTLSRNVPPAFDFAMFADEGITIHHHAGNAFIAPRISTSGVHTNGDAKIDSSSEWWVTDKFQAVGTIEIPGSTPNVPAHPHLSYNGGTIPAGDYDTTGNGGYTWRYNIGGVDLCYPGAIPHGEPGHETDHTIGRNGCTGTDRYYGGVRITGTVEAGGLKLGASGRVDGNVVVDDDGDFDIDGVINPGPATRSVEPPAPIEFPSLDFESTYLPRATNESDPSTCPDNLPPAVLGCDIKIDHVFSGDDDFFATITDPAHGLYRKIVGGTHSKWSPSDGGEPDYILARGDWYIYGGVNFTVDAVVDAMEDHGISVSGAVPPVVIAGSLISPDGGMTMKGRLYLVGRNNRTDFLDPSQPEGVNTSIFFSNTGVVSNKIVEPGILAAGGSISGNDFDTDNPWQTTTPYEPDLISSTWVRGLVYSGSWDAGSQSSSAEGQHWHNYDPKNESRIYGAQVGGKLHDCNNFTFSYDPIVKNAFGFSSDSGVVEIESWDEL